MRIIAGRARGLKLKTPTGLSTRPTSDRVKESLFSIINGIINFSEIEAVLDVFAGTGALGLEAISRGAKAAFFIDSKTVEIIRINAARAKFLNECKILGGDFKKNLIKIALKGMSFELIFVDPPYGKGLSRISLNLISKLDLLVKNGLIVVEHEKTVFLGEVSKEFEMIRKINYGHTTTVEIFERK